MNNVSLTAVPQSNDFPPATLRDGTGFQLSGEDIFRIKVAGVTPVPVANTDYVDAEVAAGVATSEAYADANFVNLAGDTMTGDLALPILNATTTNATTTNATNVNATTVNTSNLTGTVSVPSGSSLSGVNAGSVRAPGTIIQYQQKTWSNQTVINNGAWTLIPSSYLTVTPIFANSKMLCIVYFSGQVSSGVAGVGFSTRILMDGVPDFTPLVFHENFVQATNLYAYVSKSAHFTISNITPKVFSVQAGGYLAAGLNNGGNAFSSTIAVYEIAQ